MTVEVRIPNLGESITEVTLTSWMAGDGDYVNEGDNICEIESDKANVEIPAEISGLLKIMAQEGADLKIRDVIATITPSDVPKNAPSSDVPEKSKDLDESIQKQELIDSNITSTSKTSPAAKKILAEKGIDPNDVQGSGKGGRIIKADALIIPLEKEEKNLQKQSSSCEKRIKRTQKMSRLRKTIAKRLTEAKNTTAMLTTFNEIDMSASIGLRKRYNEGFLEKYGIKIGIMSLFTKACCLALREVPGVNAQIDGDNIIYHDYCDIGIAVSTPKGLVVPVIKDVEYLTIADIEREIKELATRARKGQLGLEEMQGGTFTITNGGIFGSMLSTPILNIPQSGILGMHNIIKRPVAIDGEVVIRPMMYVALSYDHRIVDGKESVTFLKRVKEYLEDPSRMLLHI